MSIAELIRAATSAMQANGPAARYAELARDAEALADMVSWATGVIDPDTKVDKHLSTLQQGLRQRHEQAPEVGLAALHDALGGLRDAIVRHDYDLKPTRGADEDEDFEF